MPVDRPRLDEERAKSLAADFHTIYRDASARGNPNPWADEAIFRPYRQPAPDEHFDPSHLSESGGIPVAIYGPHPATIASEEASLVPPVKPEQKSKPGISRRATQNQPATPTATQSAEKTELATDAPTVPVVWDLFDGNEIVVKERPASELEPAVKNPPFSNRRDVERRVAGPGSKAGGKSKERRRSTDR